MQQQGDGGLRQVGIAAGGAAEGGASPRLRLGLPVVLPWGCCRRVPGGRCRWCRGGFEFHQAGLVQASALGQGLEHQLAVDALGYLPDIGQGQFAQPGPAIQAVGIQPLGHGLEQELFQRHRLAQQLLEMLPAALAHHRVRVLALGQEQEARLAAVLHAGQGGFQGPKGRLAARLVAVKTEHYLRAQPVDALQVGPAGGGAQGGGGVADAVLGEGNHIHVALHHQQALQLAVGLASLVQAVEFPSLVENTGFG